MSKHQVTPAYPAVCGIQRDAQKMDISFTYIYKHKICQDCGEVFDFKFSDKYYYKYLFTY